MEVRAGERRPSNFLLFLLVRQLRARLVEVLDERSMFCAETVGAVRVKELPAGEQVLVGFG